MSKDAIAAFLKQVGDDSNLQQALAEFAARHGFKFTPRELREVDLLNFSGSIHAAATKPDGADVPEDELVDPGLGMGEFPP